MSDLDPVVVLLLLTLARRQPLAAEGANDDNAGTAAAGKVSRSTSPGRTARKRAPRPTRKG